MTAAQRTVSGSMPAIFGLAAWLVLSCAQAQDTEVNAAPPAQELEPVDTNIADMLAKVAATTHDFNGPGPVQSDIRLDVKPPAPKVPETGLIGDSSFSLLFRNYSESLVLDDRSTRDGWVQGMQARFESGYTRGYIGFGLDATRFLALKLNGGKGARNMVHVGPDSDAPNQTAWGRWGTYSLKIRAPGVVLRYGLLALSNPFLEPYDNRVLPPTFKGVALTFVPVDSLSIQAGSIDAMAARNTTFLQPLASAYSGIPFERLRYLGADWKYGDSGKLSSYVNQAKDVWNQYYGSLSHEIGRFRSTTWTGRSDVYVTRDQGARRQGRIDNTAYSLALTSKSGNISVMLGYQRILGDQYFDYTQETSGIFLSNSMGTDFNAPHEKSVQLRFNLDGAAIGVPAFQASVWAIAGWGADGATEASRHADRRDSLYGAYWKSGHPLRGGHEEFGANLVYTVKGGKHDGMRTALVLFAHNITPYYPSRGFRSARLTIDYPVRLF